MPTEILDIIATGGSGVALSSVLLYIHLGNVKRLDQQSDRLDSLLRDHYSERVEVIEKLIDSIGALSKMVEGLDSKLESVTQGIQTGLQEMRDHYTEQRVREAAKE